MHINFFSGKTKILIQAIRNQGNELENFFLDSLINCEIVQLTLKNNKVYAGMVLEFGHPPGRYVKILPFVSGYRKPVTKVIQFITPYTEVIKSPDNHISFDKDMGTRRNINS